MLTLLLKTKILTVLSVLDVLSGPLDKQVLIITRRTENDLLHRDKTLQ